MNMHACVHVCECVVSTGIADKSSMSLRKECDSYYRMSNIWNDFIAACFRTFYLLSSSFFDLQLQIAENNNNCFDITSLID